MSSFKKIAVISVVLLFTALSTQQNFAFICVNDIVPIFGDEGGEKKQEIENHVISGASLFLRAQSSANLLLNQYELSGTQPFNFTEAREYTETAISLLENARVQYVKAKQGGEETGYNTQKVELFKSFDYENFITVNRLNKDVAEKVRGYLGKGDITGIYQRAADDIGGILTTLYNIRDSLGNDVKPDIKLFWSLVQQFSTASLFGNYTTLMGTTVLNNSGR